MMFGYGTALGLLLIVPLLAFDQGGAVKMEKVPYKGWEHCIRLSNGQIELIVTTDVGPRVIRFGFVGGQNLFKEYEAQLGKTGGEEWRIYGGHRLWHAPEAIPRTYWPDNEPVSSEWDGKTLKLRQPLEKTTGIVKEIEITLDPNENRVLLVHRLINKNLWEIEVSPWCLTVMAPGGRAIFPQEPYRPHSEYVLPARPLVLWHYTNMQDPRWKWGTKYIQLKQDPTVPNDERGKQKVGFLNTLGWAAYYLNGELFLKRYGFDPKATYPDYGCNTETFTNAEMLEVETLGPLVKLPPEGKVEHLEHWFLYKVEVGEEEAEIDQQILPLVQQTEKYKP